MYIHRLDKEIPNKNLILGNCHGVAFVPRGPGDQHICMLMLTEDDEQWFLSQDGDMGSPSWLPDWIEVLERAKIWLEVNGTPDIHNGRQYGYLFKD